jgi:hypothetical protein
MKTSYKNKFKAWVLWELAAGAILVLICIFA